MSMHQSMKPHPTPQNTTEIRLSEQAPRDDFLAAMRRVAASVCVVTTAGPAGRQGATVSAFCSVSADPPTILVSLRADSRIAQTVEANGVFTTSVLPEDAAHLAQRFAGRDGNGQGDRFQDVPLLTCAEDLAPGIEGATVLACRLVRTIRAETHLLCLGRVLVARLGTDRPLGYLDGLYGGFRDERTLRH